MEKTIGFIGCGKMAQSIIQGLIRAQTIEPTRIIASAKSDETLEKVRNTYGIHVTLNNLEVAQKSDFLVLAVKPNLYQTVIDEIKDKLNEATVIITIAAGISLDGLEERFSRKVKAVRTMPNTPSLVGEGMTAMCHNDLVTDKELQQIKVLFESIGKVEAIEERLMDAIPAVSGSSPAYVYMLIEALADGAVQQGFTKKQGLNMAAQAVLGAAKMVLETGIHPAELKDHVCTPGGATIEAVVSLEQTQFRGTILKAMEQCTKKSVLLSK
ncbi:pyrroline-5-carboxylate reductase [Bacillus sp. PS06]|uniref:pyrroline-5-carboxylate reductase n=1 Tax=Bacillus sp. PS06 TaxID=2764176 RepID=UPI001782FB54|nr:pyrroline-5-carboxylate reductase [Bacillus sp. PS06]MBD8071052.1 pyrroline-5-carboxylate reductase [Bacillus sp. PS06]